MVKPASELVELLDDLFMLRAELESLDVSGQAWGAVLSTRDRRQRRQDLEDAIQEQLATFGASIIDVFLHGDARKTWDKLEQRLLPQSPHTPSLEAPPTPPPPQAAKTAPPVEPAPVAKILSKPDPAKPAQPAPPPPKAEPAVPITDEMIDRLAKRWSAREHSDFVDETPSIVARQQVLERALQSLGATPELFRTKGNVRDEVIKLTQVTDTLMESWAFASDELNGELTHWMTARARAVQDALETEYSNRLDDREQVRIIFTRLTRHVAQTRPCFVYGLMLDHAPRYGDSWLDDARCYERRLRQWFEPESEVEEERFDLDDALRRLTEEVRGGLPFAQFSARLLELIEAGVKVEDELRIVHLAAGYEEQLIAPQLQRLRRAVEADLEQALAEDQHQDSPLPEDWPYFEYTRGKHAIIIGGEPRTVRLGKLQEAFGFASIDWKESGPRMIESLTKKMIGGGVDMVIVLRAFSKHRVSGAIFEARRQAQSAGCEVILADAYGIQQVRQGIERFLGGE